MKLQCYAILAVTLCIFSSGTAFGDSQEPRDWRLVKTVLFGREGGEAEDSVIRWARSPLYYLHSKDRAHRRMLRRVVNRVNKVLAESDISAVVSFDRNDDWDGAIAFAPPERFDKFFQNIGCTSSVPDIANGRVCVTYAEDSRELYQATILVADDLSPRRAESTLLEEVYQSFGVMNDHDIFRESVNYDDGEFINIRKTLAPIDKKVLQFLYQYLEPGDDEATVRAKFDVHWATIKID